MKNSLPSVITYPLLLFKGPHNGASAITFSPDGILLAIAMQNENHTVLLFNWRTGQLKSSVDGGKKKVLCLTFSMSPLPPLSEVR